MNLATKQITTQHNTTQQKKSTYKINNTHLCDLRLPSVLVMKKVGVRIEHPKGGGLVEIQEIAAAAAAFLFNRTEEASLYHHWLCSTGTSHQEVFPLLVGLIVPVRIH